MRKSKEHEEFLKRNRIKNSRHRSIQKSKNKSFLISDVLQKKHSTFETSDVNNKMEAAVKDALRGQSKIKHVEILLPTYPTEKEDNFICNVKSKSSMIQDKLRKLKGIQIENIPKDDITRSTKIMENLTQNPVIIHREEKIEKTSNIKSKTKVEISINGNTDTVSWIKVSKHPNTITLNDVTKILMKQPKMYGLSSVMTYSYRVKVLDEGQIGFEDIDENNSVLPLFGDKIVLQCWSQ